MRFKQKQIALGRIKQGSQNRVVFEKLPNVPSVRSLHSSCGCSTPIDKQDKIIVNFDSPYNLGDGSKIITVVWSDLFNGEFVQDRLIFTYTLEK